MRKNRFNERDLSRIVRRVINEEKEEKKGRSTSITIEDVFDEVVNALDELGSYDESMKKKAMKLAKDIMYKMQDDLAYISEDYEEQLNDILGEE